MELEGILPSKKGVLCDTLPCSRHGMAMTQGPARRLMD